MTFRGTNIVCAGGYDRAKNIAARLKAVSAGVSAEFASGATATQIFQLVTKMRNYRQQLADIAAIPGIAAYAQTQEDDVSYDVAAEFIALRNAVDDVISAIVTAFPSANGFLLSHTLSADGVLAPRTFPGAALAPIRTKLDALAAQVT